MRVHVTKRGGVRRVYSIERLWVLAASLPIVEMEPGEVPEFEHLMAQRAYKVFGPWHRDRRGSFTVQDVMKDAQKVMDADLDFPIILNPEGGMMDGCHRLMKATITGKKVRVQRFEEWPPTDEEAR